MYLRKNVSRGNVYYQAVEKQKNKLMLIKHFGSLSNMIKVFQFHQKYEEAVSYLERNKNQLPAVMYAHWKELSKDTEEASQPGKGGLEGEE